MCRTLEIELNSSESGPLGKTRVGFDPAQSLLGLRSLTSCIALLLTSSKRRLHALKQMKNNDKCFNDFNEINELRSVLSVGNADEYKVSHELLQR